jgi:hypothetical protein
MALFAVFPGDPVEPVALRSVRGRADGSRIIWLPGKVTAERSDKRPVLAHNALTAIGRHECTGQYLALINQEQDHIRFSMVLDNS